MVSISFGDHDAVGERSERSLWNCKLVLDNATGSAEARIASAEAKAAKATAAAEAREAAVRKREQELDLREVRALDSCLDHSAVN